MATVVFVHAHPDDEAIATGGTMAKMADQGHRVVLVTATRGELGELPDGGLDPGESLTERRMAELDRACRILGVSRQVYLDYLDSGMAGEPTNDRAGSFASADIDEAAGRPGQRCWPTRRRRRTGHLRRTRGLWAPRSHPGPPGEHGRRRPRRHPGRLPGHHEP